MNNEFLERIKNYQRNVDQSRGSKPEYYYAFYQDVSPRRRKLPHEMRYDVERTDFEPQQPQPPRQDDFNQQQAYQVQYDQRREPEHKQTYDGVQPAGRANSYNTRITDLMTSIQDPPQHGISSLNQMIEANKGYLVLMRFRPSDVPEVISAIQDTVSTITAHTGTVIGFASLNDIRIMIANPDSSEKEYWWDARGQPNFAVCCMWFRDVFACKRWFESAPKIKQPHFPNGQPNSVPYQVIAVPLTFGRNQEPLPFDILQDGITLLWHEYPVIYERSSYDFLTNYSDPVRDCMKYYGATPHISLCKYEAGWPQEPNKFGQPGYARPPQQHARMARAIRTGWVKPNSYITVSAFPSMRAVEDYFKDGFSSVWKNYVVESINSVAAHRGLKKKMGCTMLPHRVDTNRT